MHFNSKEEKPSKFIFNPIKVICYWEDCFKMSNELDLPLRQYQKKNKFSMSWVKKALEMQKEVIKTQSMTPILE